MEIDKAVALVKESVKDPYSVVHVVKYSLSEPMYGARFKVLMGRASYVPFRDDYDYDYEDDIYICNYIYGSENLTFDILNLFLKGELTDFSVKRVALHDDPDYDNDEHYIVYSVKVPDNSAIEYNQAVEEVIAAATKPKALCKKSPNRRYMSQFVA